MALLLVSGCGGIADAPKLSDVQGVVTFQGAPLSEANVVFTPSSGPIAIGTTDAEGMFKLSTHGSPGASLGIHHVTIRAYKPLSPSSKKTAPDADDSEDQAGPPLVSSIPEKYGNPRESGLTAQVEGKKQNVFEFHLK